MAYAPKDLIAGAGQQRKAETAVKLRLALEGLKVMVFLAMISKTEATRGVGRWSLDKRKAETAVQVRPA